MRAFFDSPLWVDVQPISSAIEPLENETQAVFAFLNATARLGTACEAAYPGDEGWKCLYGQYRLPFVQTPYLLSASQFDKYQLPYNEGVMPPYNGGALAYANAFQAEVRSVVLGLPAAGQSQSAVYSSACFQHCVTLGGAFWGVRVAGVSLSRYLNYWYNGAGAGYTPAMVAAVGGWSPQRIEGCTGFGCGECHRKSFNSAPPPPPAVAIAALAAPPPPPPLMPPPSQQPPPPPPPPVAAAVAAAPASAPTASAATTPALTAAVAASVSAAPSSEAAAEARPAAMAAAPQESMASPRTAGLFRSASQRSEAFYVVLAAVPLAGIVLALGGLGRSGPPGREAPSGGGGVALSAAELQPLLQQ